MHIMEYYIRAMMLVTLLLCRALCAVAGCVETADTVTTVGAASTTPVFPPMVKVSKALVDGDSIQYVELNTLYIYPAPVFASEKKRKAYNRMVANVKKVLPIAKEVNAIIIETYEFMETLPDSKARQRHIKLVEKSIRQQYTPRMKRLTFSQGKLLIKLVYRECNSSSYELVQAFLGPLRAAFYQTFASLFGASLKKTYDPDGEDRDVERIVRQIEAGQL